MAEIVKARPLAEPGREPRRRVPVAGIVAGLLVLLVAGTCVRFGFWQLDRLEQRRSQNVAVLAAADQPPLLLDEVGFAEISRDPAAYRFRRVVVSGRFEPSGDVILRGRSQMGQPGVHLLSTLRVADDIAVVVNRGWVPAADGATVDPRMFAEPGNHEVFGIVQDFPAVQGLGVPAEREVDGFAVLSIGRLDTSVLQNRSSAPLAGFYVQQLPDSRAEGLPMRLETPPVTEGSHLSYAVQWFSFAAIFLVGFAVVAVMRTRPGGSVDDRFRAP